MDLNALKYLESHEWISVEGNVGRVGISDHAQKEISDVVFVELPEEGKVVKQKESCLVVESVKAAFDIYAPASGKITKVNKALTDNPELINQSPFGDGWLFEMELSDPSELQQLMSADTYNAQHH